MKICCLKSSTSSRRVNDVREAEEVAGGEWGWYDDARVSNRSDCIGVSVCVWVYVNVWIISNNNHNHNNDIMLMLCV